MAKSKYRFKKEFSDARIAIAGFGEEVTKDNLTDELGDRILKSYPHLAHNLELADGGEIQVSGQSAQEVQEESPKAASKKSSKDSE